MNNQRRLRESGALLFLFMTSLALSSCSDSTGPETLPASITGTVVDPAGDPIEGASILVSFRPSFEDILVPEKRMGSVADLPPADVYWIRITDACGDTIATVCDEGCDDQGSYYWDGLDDAGLRVVEGLYWYVLASSEGFTTNKLVLIHDYTEWDTENCRAHDFTDTSGRYSLSDECLGFGEMITVTDEEGNIVDERPLGRTVNLRAVSPGGSVVRRNSVTFPGSGSLRVDFVISR